MSAEDLSDLSMHDLFRLETENQSQVLTVGLLELERAPERKDHLEACMRAAHSLKGAARIVGLDVGVRVAHAMEDCFVAAQKGRVTLRHEEIDLLLRGVDLLVRISQTPEGDIALWTGERSDEVARFLAALAHAVSGGESEGSPAEQVSRPPSELVSVAVAVAAPEADRVLRVTAENLNRLLALSAESLVESRWLKPFADSLLRLNRLQHDLETTLDQLRDTLPDESENAPAYAVHAEARRRARECHQALSDRLAELDGFDQRSANLANRLYTEALAVRMRPFADGVTGFPRMVRDLARSLGKRARLEIVGDATPVDRDILEKLDAPLGHLLRNAVDHGIETSAVRRAAGKPDEGVVTLEARHHDGVLHITVSDDGAGVALGAVRKTIVARGLTNAETAEKMSDAELGEFLFLPGFTLKANVTDVSGRGVGLDAVQDMVRQVRGTVKIVPQAGGGARFQLQLPLTLSVLRTLVVEVDGEPYAFPLAAITSTLRLSSGDVEQVEGREHFLFNGRHIGLVTAHQLLGGGEPARPSADLPVIVLGNASGAYGVVVDRFVGLRELVVQPLDQRLGKIKDISAGALLDDGASALIVDSDDLVRSIEKLIAGGRLGKVQQGSLASDSVKRKRVLVVDDSLTVRELERKLLGNRGYEVEAAVDGMDGWNAVRTGRFDLVVTDVDMPRMDGIELVSLIKADPNLKAIPVMIVSYKDREEERRRGLDAGADYYLTKGSFHDETLVQAVIDLIGGGEP